MSAAIPTLLVIDDERVDRSIAIHAAMRIGYAATGAASVDEAAERLSGGERFDCVLLDLSLGAADGLQVLRLLAEATPSVGVIFASGCDKRVLEASRRMAWQLGLRVGGVLAKPIRPFELRALLERPAAQIAIPANSNTRIDPAALQWAISAGEVVPWFQPKVDLVSGAIVGAEALARWIQKDGQMVPPKDFIEVAEREGLLPMLTDMMLGDSLQACAGWRAQGADINVAVNLSPTALHDASLTHRIEQKLRLHRVPPGALTLEVTEGSAIPDTARATETLTRLRIWGVNLAVDDFGTGHSSLLALARMPFNELKIDQAFVTSSASNPESLKIVSAIASLGQALGLQVVAEGMETAVVAALMRDAGCGVGQGWHYGRAVTAATFTAMLTAGSSKAMRGALPVGAV